MLAKDEPTLQDVVVYQALYGDHGIWVRSLKVFCETIELDGKAVPRFKLIEKIAQ